MKNIFALVLLLFAIPASAHLELHELDSYLETEQDQLQTKISELQKFVKYPGVTHFLLNEPNLVFESSLQTYHECVEKKCRVFERKHFSKIASFRTDQKYHHIHNIWIDFVRIPVSSLEVWDSNSSGEKLRLLKEQIKIETLSFAL